MTELYTPSKETRERAYLNAQDYERLYEESIHNPEQFWKKQAERLDWFKMPSQVTNCDYTKAQVEWFADGQLNVSYNCLDRHLAKRGNQAALIWEGDTPHESFTYTYRQLHREVCRFANVLKRFKVGKGDRVVLYMPMIPELAIACLACTRIGAIHSVVFGGFSAESLRNRILDCQPKLVITADGGFRGGGTIPLKDWCDEALKNLTDITVIVVKRTNQSVQIDPARDHWWHTEIQSPAISNQCPPEVMNAEDPLFILYTSGSTGTPKGVLHTTGGYLLYTSLTHHYVFNYEEGDTYWCTADIGWITGHSYVLYGPLANGATTLMFEGVPQYPKWDRFWKVVEKHNVNIFYTAPTAIRAIARHGDELVNNCNLTSLKILGTVGEPINPEIWRWYYQIVGQGNLPIVDTWWQTETGGFMITPLPGAIPTKPGSATKPFFGVQPVVLDHEGKEIEGVAEGNLCIKQSWPGQMRTVYGDHQRFYDTYFSQFAGYYFTGDGCRRDEDGYYWITGRVDDVLNVSGHRLGTAEIESAIILHQDVAEAAVIGVAHEIKGQGIYAFVTLNADAEPSESLKSEIVAKVRQEIGPIATLDAIQWAPGLPKTRSGKIMRRILRKIANHEEASIGDTSTLAEPDIIEQLLAERVNL